MKKSYKMSMIEINDNPTVSQQVSQFMKICKHWKQCGGKMSISYNGYTFTADDDIVLKEFYLTLPNQPNHIINFMEIINDDNNKNI